MHTTPGNSLHSLPLTPTHLSNTHDPRYFATFIVALRKELDTVVIPAWVQTAQDRSSMLADM